MKLKGENLNNNPAKKKLQDKLSEIWGEDRLRNSGNAGFQPANHLKSEADLRIHEQLTEAGKILGIRVLDHVIVTQKGYFSFQEAGLIRQR